MKNEGKVAIVIGAGPAGLTAAYELAKCGIKPIVYESTNAIGGISQTINYKGNRIDIGGHRFFSKSDLVMDWWANFLPHEKFSGDLIGLKYQGKVSNLKTSDQGVDSENHDDVMLIRSRLSRIYYLGKFFNYPVKLELQTIKNLGIFRISKIGLSYVKARLFPLKETSLEEFYINRFGRELYLTFFKSYTEKVWGVPVKEIAPDWGAQRIKGLSVAKTLAHAIKSLGKTSRDFRQKETETSLIEYFLYPKYGPGQMWEAVASKTIELGGQIKLETKVVGLEVKDKSITSATISHINGNREQIKADFFISTMPINELIDSFTDVEIPKNVKEVSSKLPFRDFLTVGLLLKKLKVTNEDGSLIKDNWIYIQEPNVEVGRLQIFNNWSPYLVADPKTIWVGLEYFVAENDNLWNLSDEQMSSFGIQELSRIGIIDVEDVIDSTVIRVKKTYPAYFGTYNRFDEIRMFVDDIKNLFLIGRNGMHRYNNQDHSMLTAMTAVKNITDGITSKENIWAVNVEQEYHEEKGEN